MNSPIATDWRLPKWPALLLGVLLLGLASRPVEAGWHHHRHMRNRPVAQRSVMDWAAQAETFAPPYIYHTRQPCSSLDDCDRKDYDESGTRGRMGLGASPYHPEGPGNPSGP